MAEVKWIKLVADMFDNRKIKQIRKMPDSDGIIVIWMQILCLAGSTNDNGLVYFSKDIPYTDEMLATEFDRPVATIRMALSVFVKFQMIEIVNDILMVSNWEKYQNESKLGSIREYNRDKQREYRSKQKMLVNDIVNDMSMTCQTCQDTDIDIEIDKEEDKEKNIGVFENYANGNPDILKALKDFDKMRKAIKKPMTDRAKEMLLKELDKLSSDGENIIDCINQSVFHNWQSVYAVKRGEKGGSNQQSSQSNENGGWDIKPSVKV